MKRLIRLTVFAATALVSIHAPGQDRYRNFKVSVYTRAYEVQKMEDPRWLDSTWEVISSQIELDKIYLETHRDLLVVDRPILERAKKFFEEKGLEVAGGITYTVNERNFFETFCYTREDQRKKVREIIEYTASLFDEIILDDFFFTSCKCEQCVKAKGDRDWAGYRLELMTRAAEDLIMGPAKKVNPDSRVIIKYPNWYEHFQEMGFNLETQPAIFDGLYTGTESRDAVLSEQHLQPYLSYLVFRFFHNLKPGKNGGGWVDTGGMRFYDRYAEQLWLTILAGAPEMTLFDYRQMLYPHRDGWIPGWREQETSFRYGDFLPVDEKTTMAKAAAQALDVIDPVAGKLGDPYGIKSYKPFHSSGEDFLENYLGMVGIPIELVPEFPDDPSLILLTEHAKKDPELVRKIEQRLLEGRDVLITSGLLDALQDSGIRKLVNLEYTSRKALVSEYLLDRQLLKGTKPVWIPQVQYSTNDSWEMISGMDAGLGWPLLHQAGYASGKLYLLTVPENFADLYQLPSPVLNRIRETVCRDLGVCLRSGPKVSLFLYDNGSLVVHSFNDEPVEVEVILDKEAGRLIDIQNGSEIELIGIPEKYSMKLAIPPHSFRAVNINPN